MRLGYGLCTAAVIAFCAGGVAHAAGPVPVKVMIVSMFGPEAETWRSHRDLRNLTVVPGLPAD